MTHETLEFLYHRGITLFAIAAGYWYARVSSRSLHWTFAIGMLLMGLLAAGLSRLGIGSEALPFYHPVFFFGILGVTAVITSHTMRIRTKTALTDKITDQDRPERESLP